MDAGATKAFIGAKRTLLRQQTELVGQKLPWLLDPTLIPADALGYASGCSDLPYLCFTLGSWFLVEIVQATEDVQQHLSWQEAFAVHRVPVHVQPRVLSAVLEPSSRYAPGIFAMAEIVAAVPMAAKRECVPLGDWGRIARATEKFGAKLSYDGPNLHVIIRNYLREPEETDLRGHRVLDVARLRLDDKTGISSVTPIHELVAAGKSAIARHIGSDDGVCVALTAKAPTSQSMYSAIWSAFTAAAEHLIFPNIKLNRASVPAQESPDTEFAVALETLAAQRAEALRCGLPGKIWQAVRDKSKFFVDDARRKRSPACAELADKVESLFRSPEIEHDG